MGGAPQQPGSRQLLSSFAAMCEDAFRQHLNLWRRISAGLPRVLGHVRPAEARKRHHCDVADACGKACHA